MNSSLIICFCLIYVVDLIHGNYVLTETKAKKVNIFVKAKEEIKSIIHHDKSKHHHHDKETHGQNDDIDENTPITEVKGPNVFERVKEEFEAVLQAIHPKKES
jgi:hypothetical protein